MATKSAQATRPFDIAAKRLEDMQRMLSGILSRNEANVKQYIAWLKDKDVALQRVEFERDAWRTWTMWLTAISVSLACVLVAVVATILTK